jgi:L-fuconate dehydratase
LTFTIGRGNEVCVAAIEAFRHLVVGQTLAGITTDFAGFWRRLASDSQLRWLGPEKGVIHLALAAVVNAVWDLYAKAERKPLWKLLADMTSEQVVVHRLRYITDAMRRMKRAELLERWAPTAAARPAPALRLSRLHDAVVLEYLTQDRARCREAIAEGFTHFKVKVGQTRRGPAARGWCAKEIATTAPDARRQPAMGRRRCDRLRARSRAIRRCGSRANQPG